MALISFVILLLMFLLWRQNLLCLTFSRAATLPYAGMFYEYAANNDHHAASFDGTVIKPSSGPNLSSLLLLHENE